MPEPNVLLYYGIDKNGVPYRSFKLIQAQKLTSTTDASSSSTPDCTISSEITAKNRGHKENGDAEHKRLGPRRAAFKIFSSWSKRTHTTDVDVAIRIQETTRGAACSGKISSYICRRSLMDTPTQRSNTPCPIVHKYSVSVLAAKKHQLA